VVDAAFGELDGRDALFALLTAPDASYHVETGMTTHRRTIHDDWEHLLMETMRREDTGTLPSVKAPETRPHLAVVHPTDELPSAAPRPSPAGPPIAASTTSLPARRSAAQAPSGPSSRRSSSLGWVAVTGAAVIGLAAVLVLVSRSASYPPGDRVATAVPPPVGAAAMLAAPVEAGDLTGPGDAPPRLLDGGQPVSPEPDLALKPVVTCRVLVDTEGRVAEAQIFRSRLDLARFEEVALETVRVYRFRPATRSGQAVPAWTNVPVTFR
jgi:TonB family protein